MTIHDRFNLLLEEIHHNANSLAGVIGVTQTAIRKIVEGQNLPSSKILIPLITKYPKINSNWLLTGQGDMFWTKNDCSEKEKTILLLEKNIKNMEETMFLLRKAISDKDQEIKNLKRKW